MVARNQWEGATMKTNRKPQPELVEVDLQASEVASLAANEQLLPPSLQAAESPAVPQEVDGVEEQDVRALAYELYGQRGRNEGRDIEDWLEAEALVRQRRGAARG